MQKLDAQGPSSEVDLSKVPSELITKNESSKEETALSKLPSELITKNESSKETPEIEYAPVPDKFSPLFDNSGPIEFRVYCEISNKDSGTETVKCQGTVNNDKIVGTNKSDDIVGLDGDDFILSGKGNDFVDGGNGRDQIHGGSENDRISGGNDEDLILAESGNDLIYAGGKVNSSMSEDTRYRDLIDCGRGDDRVYVDDIDVYRNCEEVNGVKVGIESESRLPSAGLMP